jgi:hypothetical protein
MCCTVVLEDLAAAVGDLGTPEGCVHRHLEPRPESAAACRRFVAEATTGLLDADTGHSAVLLASELATNGILHARTPLQVGVAWWPTHVLVAVADRHPDTPEARPHDLARPSGRGLPLVDALSEHWGVSAHGPGKTLWFLVARSEFGGDDNRA